VIPGTLGSVLQRRSTILGLAALLVLGVAATGLLTYLVPVARDHDVATLNGFLGLNQPSLEPLLWDVAHLADPAPYALLGIAMAVVALARGRTRVAIAVPLVLVAAGATTEALKHVTASPRFDEWLGDAQIADASWPSGHATASMALALCAVMAAPPRWRAGAAAVGAAFAIAVSFSILALGWHFPSDVLGGYMVAGFWALVAVAALGGLEWRPVDVRPALAVVAVAVAAGVLVASAYPARLADYASAHTTFVAGAALIATVAAALAALLAAGARPRSAGA